MSDSPASLIEFWFSPPVAAHWFDSTPALDAEIRERFEPLWRRAVSGALDAWEQTADGALALAIVLDQLPLNMFRGQPEAFASEAQARDVAVRAIALGFDRQLPPAQRAFLYLPFMHSEEPADQERCVALYEASGLGEGLRWALHHRELIRRFGRFPHRNAILGRESTPEECAYLSSPEAFLG